MADELPTSGPAAAEVVADPDRTKCSPAKTLVHFAYPLWRKHLLVSLARAKQLQAEGQEVVATYCNAKRGTCATNYAGSPAACAICRKRVRETLEQEGIRAIPLDSAVPESDAKVSVSEGRSITEGVHSGVISTFRIMNADSRRVPYFARLKRRYFKTAMSLLQGFKQVISKETPTSVEVFNGRHACSRFVITAAHSTQTRFNTFEITASQKPIVFAGHLVHDRVGIQRRILENEADMDVAEEYYANRRRPRTNKYAKKHAADFVPPEGRGFRRKISVFLSSQDEFASLGKEWESPFLNYAPIIEQAVRQNPEDLFCIRFHPNQADMVTDVITPFRDIAELPNVVVYYPTDTANTYTLVDWSDLVITFGSTVTVEACWVGKPVISLGPCYFDSLDVAHVPATIEEFLEILPKTLPPKSRENAARFAVYQMTDHDAIGHIENKGGKMVADGVRLKHPWLAQIARTSDNLFCHAIRYWTEHTASQPKKAA